MGPRAAAGNAALVSGAGARRFAVRPAAACGTVLAAGGPVDAYRRCIPVIRGPVTPWMPRAVWERFYEEVTPPAAQVVLLRDATVRGPGVITLPGDVIVAESLINSHEQALVAPGIVRVEGGYAVGAGLPKGMPIPGRRRYVLLKQLWDTNYGHWLIETLPRMGLLQGVVDVAACRFIVSAVDEAMRAVVADSLAGFGVTAGQIARTGGAAQTFGELIYPLPLTVQPWVKAPLAVRVLEQLAERMGGVGGAERVFVRRPPTGRRALRNQAEVEEMLVRRGYVGVSPATLGFAQQVAAFGAARRVVGVLGAECANLAFAPAGVRFLGLAPPDMLDDFFWDLVSHKAGQYRALHGAAEEVGMNAAFSVDLGQLAEMLEE